MHRIARPLAVRAAAVVVAVASGLASAPDAIAAAPPVRAVTVARLDQPVGFTFTPRGRIVYLERATGRVRLLTPSAGRDVVLHRIGGVDSDGERGALGVALHPRFPRPPFVYVYVSRSPGDGALRNQLLRFRLWRGRLVEMRVLLQSPIVQTNHNGGRVAFGPDGKLYVAIGDGGADPGTAQDLDGEPRGKILRLSPDGSVPPGNPFDTAVWSYGHRNSFGFAFDPRTGRLWESDNGPECNDELNRIVAGGNFAWGPTQTCGAPPEPGDTNRDGPMPRRLPQHTFGETVAVTGVAFCDRCALGAFYDGTLLAGCANGTCKDTVGPVMHVELAAGRWAFAAPPKAVPLLGHNGAIYSMEVGPGGRVHFSDARGIYRLVRA